MDGSEFQAHARDLIAPSPSRLALDPTEVELRRAVSSAYYALFHCLTSAGSQIFLSGGDPLRNQVTRAFNHTAMRKVCDAYVRSPIRPFPPPLDQLNPGVPNARLINVAATFARLQDARHTADYDLAALVEYAATAQLVRAADAALTDFAAVQALPETQVFLTALLLADRWTRRG